MISFLGWIGLFTLLSVAGIEVMARHAEPAELVAARQRLTAAGSRVWYARDEYPRVLLPDGEAKTIRSVINVSKKMRYGDYVWNEQFIPPGAMWIRVDLDRQLISVFRGGHEIGTAVILYGADSKPTPNGSFPILQKAADYHSMTYDAAMPFMLRLTRDGVAIHGSNVRRGAATHGCIGVPTDFARRLFGQMELGDPVVIVGSPS